MIASRSTKDPLLHPVAVTSATTAFVTTTSTGCVKAITKSKGAGPQNARLSILPRGGGRARYSETALSSSSSSCCSINNERVLAHYVRECMLVLSWLFFCECVLGCMSDSMSRCVRRCYHGWVKDR